MEALAALANANFLAGRFAASDTVFRRLTASIEEQGRGQTLVAAVILNNWSAMLQDAGQHMSAVPLSERAVTLAREQDSENGASQTQLQTYGNALSIVGRAAQAIEVVEEGRMKARRSGSPRRLFGALVQAATAYREAAQLDEAARALREAEAILKADAASPPHLHATLERHRARLALARGDAAGAAELARRALARIEGTSRPPAEVIQLVLILAEAQNQHEEFEAARAMAERALKMATERLGEMKHSYNAGQAHLELGVALAGQGNLQAGREEVQQGLAHLRSSVGPEAPSTRRAQSQLQRLSSGDR
jgi:tetratricopeptide (TPR) repeat protein